MSERQSQSEGDGFSRQIVAGALEGIVVVDRRMRITTWNPSMERLTRVPRERVLGSSAIDLFPFLGPAGVADLFERALAGETCSPIDVCFEVPGTGEQAWASTGATPLRDAAGEIVGVIGMVRDATDQHRVEESLRASEERLIRAQSIAHVGNWELDLRTRAVWATPEAFHIYGVERVDSTLPLASVQAAVLPEYRPLLDEALRRTIEGGDEYDVEFVIRRADDGQIRILHSAAELVRAADGTPVSVLGALQDVTELKAAERDAVAAAARLRRTVDGTVTAMGAVVEVRDPYTAGHQLRVAQLTAALGAELGLDQPALETLRLSSELHDIGKVAVPTEILTKPGRLSDMEFAIVKAHSAAGADILATVDFGAPVADIVRWHHERLDGSGYPDGLAEAAIPMEARVIAVADVVEAMASHRPYRPALGIEAALAEIERGAGGLYDADVAAACLRSFAGGFAFDA